MSFARNFALGQQAAQTAIDTYQNAREKRRLKEVVTEAPTDVENAYTSEDARQLRAISEARDPSGKPYYELKGFADNQGYGLKSQFDYEGKPEDRMAYEAEFRPRARVSEFMGNRYAPEDLSEDRMQGLRTRRMADIIAERDPVRGLAMRQSAKSSERDDERFGWEQRQSPLQLRQLENRVVDEEDKSYWDMKSRPMVARSNEFGAMTAERNYEQVDRARRVQRVQDDAMKMPQEKVQETLQGYLNTNKSDLPLMLMGKDKNGFVLASRDPATGEVGPQFTVPLSVGQKLVTGMQLAEAGYGNEALTLIAGADENLNALVKQYSGNNLEMGKFNNDAVARSGMLSVAQQNANASSKAMRPGFSEVGTDAEGRPIFVDPTRMQVDENGVVKLPPGVVGRRLAPTLSDAEKIAYGKAMDAIAELPEGSPPAAAAAVYRRFGLDPAKFGAGPGLPTGGRFGGGDGGGGDGGGVRTNPSPASTTPAAGLVVPLARQLAEAAKNDAGRTDQLNFRRLAEKVAATAAQQETLLKSLKLALPKATTPESRATIENKIKQLEDDLKLVPGILSQRKALGN